VLLFPDFLRPQNLSTSQGVPVSTPARHRIPLVAYTDTPDQERPWVLSYFAQRRIAGWIGILLPIIVLLITTTTGDHNLPDSISASYYTFARNYFVGSLCAVGVFLISGVGYDEDRLLSFFAGAMAFAVAFSPCRPPQGSGIPIYGDSNVIHGIAAASLFLDLGWTCLYRFTRTNNQQSPSASPQTLTPRKRQRNGVYRFCGIVMFASMAVDACGTLYARIHHTDTGHLALVVEWLCLWMFGVAWLIKGQQFLADTEA
jgi:hypothetical protein